MEAEIVGSQGLNSALSGKAPTGLGIVRVRRKGAAKRGGDALRITLTGLPVAENVLSTDFVEVLEQLAQLGERKAGRAAV